MTTCQSTLNMYAPAGTVVVRCVIQAGHNSPHQAFWVEGSKEEQPGATCPSCKGRGTLEKYVMNGKVIVQWGPD